MQAYRLDERISDLDELNERFELDRETEEYDEVKDDDCRDCNE